MHDKDTKNIVFFVQLFIYEKYSNSYLINVLLLLIAKKICDIWGKLNMIEQHFIEACVTHMRTDVGGIS